MTWTLCRTFHAACAGIRCTAMFFGVTVLCLTATAQRAPAAAGSSAAEAAGQVVAGRVTSSADGHPIARATVTLSSQQSRSNRRQGPLSGQSQTAQTDAEGRYRFPAEPAGRYTLRAGAAGYLSSLYLEHEGYSSAIVTGAGLPTEDLRFALVPEASLHGHILDETGEPVKGNVTLYRESGDARGGTSTAQSAEERFRPINGAQADDDGSYDFAGLRPGRYYLAVNATPWYAVHPQAQGDEERMPYRTALDPALDVAYPVTFYPHATTESGAVPIVLKSGQRATANMLMQAEHAVTLTVQVPPVDASAPNAPRAYPMLWRKVFGNEQPAGGQVSGRAGETVVLTGVAPGQYVVRSYGRGGPSAETTVDLSSGSATTAMHAVSPGGTGDVRIALHAPANSTSADSVEINLQRVGAPRGSAPVLPGKVEQGIASFSDVPAGNYRLRMFHDGNTWNISRLSVGGKVIASKLLPVTSGTVDAEVVYSQYSPEVDGTVHASDGKVHAGSLVVLVPAGADTGEDMFRADQSDLDGGFQFFNVLPGNYLLVAIDNDWELNWQNTAALMPYLPHALPVTVAPSGPRVIALQEPVAAQQK